MLRRDNHGATPTNTTRERIWQSLAVRVDNFVLPLALGLLSMLLLVQGALWIPTVRERIDAVTGRFTAMPKDIVPASAQNAEALVTLYASPGGDHSLVEVDVDGRKVADFSQGAANVKVHEGNHVTIVNTGDSAIVVSVDQSSPDLLEPAPGQSVDVGAGETQSLPVVRFTN